MKTTYIAPEISIIYFNTADLLDTIQQSTGGGGVIDDGGRLDTPRFFYDNDADSENYTTHRSIWDNR